jgi:hypothetical protein
MGVFSQETGAAGRLSLACFYMAYSFSDFVLTIKPTLYLLKTTVALLDAIMKVGLQVNEGKNVKYLCLVNRTLDRIIK